MVLKSPKSVPSSRQNKSRRSTEPAKSRGVVSPSKSRRQASLRQASRPTDPPKPAPKKKKKKPKDAEQDPSAQIQEPVQNVVKPANQLELDAEELAEDAARILTGDDPNKPKNVCKFSFKDQCYKPDPPGQGDNMALHFSLVGNSMHVDGDECRRHRERAAASREQEETDGRVTADGQTPATGAGASAAGARAKNQFDYSERASQTVHRPRKSRGVNTEPPPVTQYQDDVSQWKIHDSYKSEFLITQSMDKEGAANINFEDKLASIVENESSHEEADTIHSENMERALKTMERLVNQNAEDEVFQDFKYFEDRADGIRKGEGTLLPLWKFSAQKAGRKQVTSLCWNPRYNDMFAAGYGSYDFMRQGTGMVCCFSLKNTSYPEYVVGTESGAMCLDFHPHHPSLLAVGCYDGTVLAYDISNGTRKPIYSSSPRSGKHSDPVWQVHWHDSKPLSKELHFYSISSDGRVANWTMNKNELKMEPIMYLKLVNSMKEDSDEPTLSGLAGGCSFDFNSKLDNLFLVGTEEGNIHECSKAYSGQYIKTYDGHHMSVHSVRWNPFHEDIFISCSADWTVKIWDHASSRCLLHFDLGNSVGDVCWSPFSSTVFAAATTDGRVHVFDLSQNKREPLCAQKVVKRARLTHAAFNAEDFIVIVGDDRGGVHSLKLSPNLRKCAQAEEEEGQGDKGEGAKEDNANIQNKKLVKLLASIDKRYAR